MELTIKKATIEDLNTIQDLNNKLFELEYNNFDPSLKIGWPYEIAGEEYFKDLIENQIIYLAIMNNEIVGYLAGSIHVEYSYNTNTLAELDNMFILEEYRKYGIGTKLFNEFKKHCKENNIQELKVTASSKNLNAIKFYQKNGFEEFETTLKMSLDN
ncbi:MAG: GNAT family N-acetyltransferase [Bacilli bacterium]|nr:GNAT family N-acetyltransferase [Bacilli bacterium]